MRRSSGNKQHTAPNSPKRNLTNSMRLHPDTRERSNKSTAAIAATETPGKHAVPERQPGPCQPQCHTSNTYHIVEAMHCPTASPRSKSAQRTKKAPASPGKLLDEQK